MSSDSNKDNMKYSAVSNQKDKYFLIHSVLTNYREVCSHEGLLKVMLFYKQSTSRCATTTKHRSEREVPGKPLLALWIW